MVRLGTLLAFVLALILAGRVATLGGAQSGPRSIAPLIDPVGPLQMLVSEGGQSDALRLVPLDPRTLADGSPGDSVALDGPGWSSIISADGSTLVTVQVELSAADPHPSEITLVVRDLVAGSDPVTFDLPIAAIGPWARLSRDGSRLVVEARPGFEAGSTTPADPPEWHVVATKTGEALAVVPSDPDGRYPTETWIDPEATRLYRLLLPTLLDSTGPEPAVVVAHDLVTGGEIGRLVIPDVLGGTWDTGRTVPVPYENVYPNTYPVFATLSPGGALSPDGRRLALVHADGDAVTLIDTERFAVERSVPFGSEAGIGTRLMALLPLAPQGAAAKMPSEGTRVRAAFAADGRHLYAWGSKTEVDADGTATAEALPLRLIDTDGGDLVAETTPGHLIRVIPAADGSSLYTISSGEDEQGGDDEPPLLLRRLDPVTLETDVERAFPGFPWVVLRPSLPSGSDYYAA